MKCVLILVAVVPVFAASAVEPFAREEAAPPDGAAVIEALNDVLADVVERVLPSLVRVEAVRRVTEEDNRLLRELHELFGQPAPEVPSLPSMGSGVIVDGRQGIVLTNSHIVSEADEVVVEVLGPDGDIRPFKADYTTDDLTDLAVLRLRDFAGFPLQQAVLGDSDEVRVGHLVIALGHPFTYSNSATFGMVSAVGRKSLLVMPSQSFIQTDAAINRGNSGGPLLNVRGEVIGINTFIVSGSFSEGSIGLGFAIPINEAMAVYPMLVSGEVSHGYLGVVPVEVSDATAALTGLARAQGAYLLYVEEDTPAQAAGLAAGDVVTEFHGRPISSPDDLFRLAALTPAGTTVEVEVWSPREPSPRRLSVVLADRAAMNTPRRPWQRSPQPTPVLGMYLEWVEGPGGPDAGVLVTRVLPGSPAEAEGIRPDDILVLMGTDPAGPLLEIDELLDAQAAVQDARDADTGRVVAILRREGRPLYRILNVPEEE